MLIPVHSAKQDVQKKGGAIKHEYSLIKGFTYAVQESVPRPDRSRANPLVEQCRVPGGPRRNPRVRRAHPCRAGRGSQDPVVCLGDLCDRVRIRSLLYQAARSTMLNDVNKSQCSSSLPVHVVVTMYMLPILVYR